MEDDSNDMGDDSIDMGDDSIDMGHLFALPYPRDVDLAEGAGGDRLERLEGTVVGLVSGSDTRPLFILT